jgi:predicted transcriptional regulator
MGDNSPTISDAELDVLKALWEHGPATVREINAHLRRRKRKWAYNTVLTLLSRLREKGFVSSEKRGVAHVFKSAVSQGELLKRQLSDLADRVCNGTASPLVYALVEGQQFTAEEIARFRKLIDELELPE